MNPLIIIPSPRDLTLFNKATSLLRYDKLWIKYYYEEHAYSLGRWWFLDHSEYTHLIILPDDLIVNNTHIERLISKDYNDAVISGWCNVDQGKLSTISYHVPPEPSKCFGIESYKLLTLAEAYKIKFNSRIHVGFTSFALTLIPRKIVELIEFRSENNTLTDVNFSRDCAYNNICQLVDTSIICRHLKVSDNDPEWLSKKQVGIKSPYIKFELTTK